MEEHDMVALTEGVATKADKMRILERHGVSRADIARFLNVRYQQVRNTLEGDKRTGYNPTLPAGGRSGHGIRYDGDEEPVFAVLDTGSDGSVRIPSEIIDRVPGDAGEDIYAVIVSDGVFVTSLSGAMRKLSRAL